MIKGLLILFTLTLFVSCAEESASGKSLFKAPTNTPLDPNDTEAAVINNIIYPSDATYIYNELLNIDIEFSESVVTDGDPTLEIDINGELFELALVAGNASSVFTFASQITIEEQDLDGIEVTQIKLNGSSLVDAGLNDTDLDLSLQTLSAPAVLVDSIRPTVNSIEINAGELYTTNSSATLNLDTSLASEMLISASSDCSTESFEAYAVTKSLTLDENDLNEYYVQFRTSAGSLSDCILVSITHDNLAPDNAIITLSGDASDIASDTSSWSEVSDNSGSGIDHYEFAVSTSTDEADIVSGGEWVNVGLNLSHQITPGLTLTGGVDYYTLIKSVDIIGNESISASNAWNITVSPEIVANLEVSERTESSITLGWSLPEDNGTPITDYVIEYMGGGLASFTIYNDGVSSNTNATITGLDPETSYQFKLRAFNGTNYSGYSNTVTVETLPNIDFFTGGYKAINISGASANQVVSMADSNELYLDGALLTTLDKGETHSFSASDFSVLEGNQPFYVAGKLGTGGIGGSNDQGNATWATSSWVGKEFLTILSRNAPLKLKVYAFTDSTIEVRRGGALEDSQVLTEGNGHTFTLSTLGSYEITSTGFIVAFSYGNQSGGYYDPKPLLPPSTDIVGFPSSSAQLSSLTNSNSVTTYHSGGSSATITVNSGTLTQVNPQGTSSQYSSQTLRLRASEDLIANSVADSDGYCAAPFAPVSMMKSKFAINVSSDYVAFASDRAVTITATFPDTTTATISLTRSGSDKSPYYAKVTNYPAGTVFEGDNPYQAWYEPDTSTNAGDDDETIMFGWD